MELDLVKKQLKETTSILPTSASLNLKHNSEATKRNYKKTKRYYKGLKLVEEERSN